MPTLGQQAVYRLGSSRYVQAIVTKIVSGDTVQLVCFSDGSAWGDGDPASLGAKVYDSIALGSGVGEWQPGTLVGDAITAATTNLATYSYTDGGDAARCALPGAGSGVSLALATPRRPSTTRPTRVDVYGQFTLATALLAAQGATVVLQVDSSATPSTTVAGPLTVNNGIGTVGTAQIPWTMSYEVPTGHYYQVVQSATVGTGAASITHINETAR
jgi:hypothetical protein